MDRLHHDAREAADGGADPEALACFMENPAAERRQVMARFAELKAIFKELDEDIPSA